MKKVHVATIGLFICAAAVGCGKKKKTGDVGASIMKSQAATAALIESEAARKLQLTSSGSMVQSFTPTSLKIPIYQVNLCSGNSSCTSIYSCSGNTAEACGVEISKIDAFVDAINSGTAEIEEGDYDHVGVSFCPDDNRSGIQHISMTGTVKIQGVDYATDPTSGLVAGTAAKELSVDIKGGCASYYPVVPAVSVSKGSSTRVRLFFDASLYAYGGISGGASNTDSYNQDSCVGSASAYACASVITIVSTIDSGNPTTEHYLIANTASSATNAPTASVALYFSSDGTPIGGVQNPYRLSGSQVAWGLSMNGGLGLYPKTVDASTVSFGEPEGSVSLADWFKNFKRATHSGAYTYAAPGNVATDSTYSATKL